MRQHQWDRVKSPFSRITDFRCMECGSSFGLLEEVVQSSSYNFQEERRKRRIPDECIGREAVYGIEPIRTEELGEIDDLQLGRLMEKVLQEFGEEILCYGSDPEERAEHLETLGRMFRRHLREAR